MEDQTKDKVKIALGVGIIVVGLAVLFMVQNYIQVLQANPCDVCRDVGYTCVRNLLGQ